MAENITLAPVTSFTNDSSAVATVNANNVLIQTAFTDVLGRSGASPNSMQSVLDMNSFNIINLPPPATLNSPVRLVDAITPSIALTVPPVGTSGSTVPLLNGINTWSATQTFNSPIISFGNNSWSGTQTFSNSLTAVSLQNWFNNTGDVSWAAYFPLAVNVLTSSTHGNSNAVVGYTLNDLAINTNALPTAVIGYGKLTTAGNIVFGIYGLGEIYSTNGTAVAEEVTVRNFSTGNATTVLPPNHGIGTPSIVTDALHVTCGGNFNSSIGIYISPEAGSTTKFATGIYIPANSVSTHGIYIESQPGVVDVIHSNGFTVSNTGGIISPALVNQGSGIVFGNATDIITFGSSGSFSANGAVATALTSVGPVGSNTTVQTWLTIKDNTNTTRYIPCF